MPASAKDKIDILLKKSCEEHKQYTGSNECPVLDYVSAHDTIKEVLEELLDNLGLKSWKNDLSRMIIYQNIRYDLLLKDLTGRDLVDDNDVVSKWEKYDKLCELAATSVEINRPLWISKDDWFELSLNYRVFGRSCIDDKKPWEVPAINFLEYFDVCDNVKRLTFFGILNSILEGRTDFGDAIFKIYQYGNKIITGSGRDGTHRIYASVLLAPKIEKIRLHLQIIQIKDVDSLKATLSRPSDKEGGGIKNVRLSDIFNVRVP